MLASVTESVFSRDLNGSNDAVNFVDETLFFIMPSLKPRLCDFIKPAAPYTAEAVKFSPFGLGESFAILSWIYRLRMFDLVVLNVATLVMPLVGMAEPVKIVTLRPFCLVVVDELLSTALDFKSAALLDSGRAFAALKLC